MLRGSNDSRALQYKLQSDDNSVTDSLSQAWDASYRKGRYGTEPALKFATDVIRKLKANPRLMNGRGLYVGCGNGRNYTKMVESGLNLTGLDVSGVALTELSKKLPRCARLLHCGDFLDYQPFQDGPSHDDLFQYVIAIQVFQHGNMNRVERYFKKASMLLETGGMLFLRVNAKNTIVQHDHDVIEEDGAGGFTVRYNEGPKKGLAIRFFSKKDVHDLIRKNNMTIMRGLKNVTTKRVPSGTGSWSQWELVARKD